MDWKKLGKRILYPSTTFICALCPVAAALLIYSLTQLETEHILSIVSYLAAFYALVTVVVRVPEIIRFCSRFKRSNGYIVRYTSDVRFRIQISLQSSFVFNAVYAVFQLCLGMWHHSVWFYAMAGYYLLLAVMRLMLARYTGKHEPGNNLREEWRKYRLCGVFLLLMTLTLMIFVIYFIWKIRVFRHHEITTIAMAAYTFTSLALAVKNVVRYKSYGSPVFSAAKAISLASAVVSMLTLENAMLTAFGQDGSEVFKRIMLSASGAAVIITVNVIALYMIINATRKCRKIDREDQECFYG